MTAITPYHALKEASLKLNEYLVIFGASGNTGLMAIQFGNKMYQHTYSKKAKSIVCIQYGLL
jgi:NADPH:quinone reductase-like Zn-dependent oxidoreductase